MLGYEGRNKRVLSYRLDSRRDEEDMTSVSSLSQIVDSPAVIAKPSI